MPNYTEHICKRVHNNLPYFFLISSCRSFISAFLEEQNMKKTDIPNTPKSHMARKPVCPGLEFDVRIFPPLRFKIWRNWLAQQKGKRKPNQHIWIKMRQF